MRRRAARLPQVEVVQVPHARVDVPTCLDHVARLEVLSLTREDLAKTADVRAGAAAPRTERQKSAGRRRGDYLAAAAA